MTRVTSKTFVRKTTETFEWEPMGDVTRSGYVEVRSTASNRRFTVEVR